MAKSTSSKSTGTSRIRFVMVEAEVPDGDLGQITTAIQNALRAPTVQAPRTVANSLPKPATAADPSEDILDVELEEPKEFEEKAKSSQPRQRRSPPKATVIELDLTSGTSLSDYVASLSISSHRQRYLTIAAYLKEHRNINEVNANHIYTGYRTLNWPANIVNFSQTLRDLKKA